MVVFALAVSIVIFNTYSCALLHWVDVGLEPKNTEHTSKKDVGYGTCESVLLLGLLRPDSRKTLLRPIQPKLGQKCRVHLPNAAALYVGQNIMYDISLVEAWC